MDRVKAHVRTNNTATIICPKCSAAKNISAETFLNGKHRLRVRCRCNELFFVDLDFRKHYRKSTALTGYYAITSANGVGGGAAQITNISREGLGFSVSGVHGLKVGQTVVIEFELNDKKNTKLKKDLVVRCVDGNQIGCEFRDKDHMEKALGFFLQS